MPYKIKFAVVDEDGNSAITDSAPISVDDITLAEDIFYRITRNLRIYDDAVAMKEKDVENEVEQDLMEDDGVVAEKDLIMDRGI